jgi:hypothetical protein
MEIVSGWLFLNLERTRLVFVADALEVEESFEWNLLLHGDCLERFIFKFAARPTTEGPLQGYRVDASRQQIKHWLADCKVNAEAHAQRTAKLHITNELKRHNDPQSDGTRV